MGAGKAELAEGTALDRCGHVALLDLGDTGGLGDGEGVGDEGDLLKLAGVGLGLALLGVVALAGEDDQALLVGLEALDVGGEGLLTDVLATGVDGNADGGGKALGDASLL